LRENQRYSDSGSFENQNNSGYSTILKCLKNNNLPNPVKEAKFKPGKSKTVLT
jgi:hypothetical protein